jgi:alpha-1,3-rhamnosyl/mannosyltransferase
MLRLTRAVWRDRPDVFWSPSVYTYFPLPPGQPSLVTIHDTIAERHPELTMPSHRARLFWRAKVQLALWQATLVLTVSEFSAREITQILHVSPDRLRVAGEAAAAAFRPGTAREAADAATAAGVAAGAPWFTYVGGFTPHKHVDRIVRAHGVLVAEALARGTAVPYLILVGTTSADNFHGVGAGINEAIAECGTSEFVRWTGYLPDEKLRHLLTGTRALLLPSENEGFGLPAVEAAASRENVAIVRELLEGFARRDVFRHRVDEGRERLDLAARPEPDPFVVATAAQDHRVLGRDHGGKVGIHRLVPISEEAVRVLGDAVE